MEDIEMSPGIVVRFQTGFVHPDLAILEKLDSLIETHFKENKRELFYAQQLGISIKSINRVLRLYKQVTLNRYIKDRIHAEAISLLIGTYMSIKEIAYELGYSEPGYFNRIFVQKEFLTPKVFRSIHTVLK